MSSICCTCTQIALTQWPMTLVSILPHLKLHSTGLQVYSTGRNRETNTVAFQDFQHSKDAMHSNAKNIMQLLILWIIMTHFFLYLIFIIMHLFQNNFPSKTMHFTIINLTPCASAVWPGNLANSWEEAQHSNFYGAKRTPGEKNHTLPS